MQGSKTSRHITIKKRPRGPDGRGGSLSQGAMEGVLRGQNFVALGKQALRERQNISNGGRQKHLLEGDGIGALVEDKDLAVTDEEGPRRCKIADFDVGEWIKEELIRAG